MSLVNKVLKDLENRGGTEAKREAGDKILTDLQAPVNVNKRRFPKKTLILVLLLLLVVFAVVLYLNKDSLLKVTTVKLNKPSPTKQFAVVPATNGPNLVPVVIKNMAFIPLSNGRTADLVVFLSHETHYSVQHQAGKLIITLQNAAVANELPSIAANSWFKTVALRQLADGSQILVTLQPGVVLQKLQLLAEPQPQLHIRLTGAQTSAGVMQKTIVPLTPQQRAAQYYQQGLQLINTKQLAVAAVKLKLALKFYPNYPEVREVLATLLFNLGRIQEANIVAATGLKYNPANLKLVTVRAHCLARFGRQRQALQLVQLHSPLLQSNPNYYAFLAYLYQQQQQPAAAAKIYGQLVQYRPGNGLWWLGLGMALEAKGQKNAALQAYSQALRNGNGLTPEVRTFLQDKLAAIN